MFLKMRKETKIKTHNVFAFASKNLLSSSVQLTIPHRGKILNFKMNVDLSLALVLKVEGIVVLITMTIQSRQ
jgi:hypothetical protein